MSKDIVREIGSLNIEIFNAISKRYKNLDINVTPLHGKVMEYLSSHDNVCQRDLEGEIKCNKSTISAIIDVMEKNGLIVRGESEDDSRKKILSLTDKGIKFNSIIMDDKYLLESIMYDDISDEELDMFNSVIKKLRKNLERM